MSYEFNVKYRKPVRETAKPIGTKILGTYQSRAAKEGIVTDVNIKVKTIPNPFTQHHITYQDTYLTVKWEDDKVSRVDSRKVIDVSRWSKGNIESLKPMITRTAKLYNRKRYILNKFRKMGIDVTEQEIDSYIKTHKHVIFVMDKRGE